MNKSDKTMVKYQDSSDVVKYDVQVVESITSSSLLDENAQAEAFIMEALAYSSYLYHIAKKLTNQHHLAQDIVQETYLKAYKYFRQFEKGSNLKAWLSKILVNTYYNYYQKNIKNSPLSLETTTHPSINNHISSEDQYLVNSFSPLMLEAVEKLSIDQREVIFLVDIEGFSYLDAAAFLSLPKGTVMSRLSRGREKIKEELIASGYHV